MFELIFKILGAAVPEKYLTKKKRKAEHKHTRKHCYGKTKTIIHLLYTLYAGGIITGE